MAILYVGVTVSVNITDNDINIYFIRQNKCSVLCLCPLFMPWIQVMLVPGAVVMIVCRMVMFFRRSDDKFYVRHVKII